MSRGKVASGNIKLSNSNDVNVLYEMVQDAHKHNKNASEIIENIFQNKRENWLRM